MLPIMAEELRVCDWVLFVPDAQQMSEHPRFQALQISILLGEQGKWGCAG